jgi:uncharacterized protein (DUF488 family)
VTEPEKRVGTGIYTIGHSNQTLDSFLSVLADYKITAVADVRSYPYSKANPQFNREKLTSALEARKIAYVFLGSELGARSDDQGCYLNGKVQYDWLARTELFQEGLRRVQRGMEKYRVTLMCAEGEPLACHRAILVSRYLRQLDISVQHILKGGRVEDHDVTMIRLLQILGIKENLLLRNKTDLFSEGYRIQGEKIAYEVPNAEARNRELSSVPKGQ